MALINKARPNTGVDNIFLSPKAILCVGEDWQELLTALASITTEKPTLHHEYRCYRFSKFSDFSLIWSGMGTGCLEPLLYELHEASIIETIVLIGTAGATSTEKVKLGELYIAEEAFLGATAIKLSSDMAPFRPEFSKDSLAQIDLKAASIASTDYYYGFSRNKSSQGLRSADQVLETAVATLLDKVDLVDMETAQFYYFCQALFRHGSLSYVSLKGAANFLVGQSLQTTHSLEILRKAIAASFLLLRVQAETLTS